MPTSLSLPLLPKSTNRILPTVPTVSALNRKEKNNAREFYPKRAPLWRIAYFGRKNERERPNNIGQRQTNKGEKET